MPAAHTPNTVIYRQVFNISENRSCRNAEHYCQIFHRLLACQTELMQNFLAAFFCIHIRYLLSLALKSS